METDDAGSGSGIQLIRTGCTHEQAIEQPIDKDVMTLPDLTLWRPQSPVSAAHQRQQDAFGTAIMEALDHLLVPYRLDERDTPDLSEASVVVALDVDTPAENLGAWVEQGGQLLIAAHRPGWDELAGVQSGESVPSELVSVHPLAGITGPQAGRELRAIDGLRLEPAPATRILASWADGGAAIAARDLGLGRVISFGVNLPTTLVRIRQGFPVTADGKPAADGTAPIDDGILKCEDGMALVLDEDRCWPASAQPTDGPYPYGKTPPEPTPVFDLPHADLWWITLHQLIIEALHRAGSGAVWLDYWPDRLPAIGHLSHDADLNVDEDAEAALAAFAKAGITVTWCQLYPGSYRANLYRRIAEAGHEHALHFNAMPAEGDITSWGRRQFLAQLAWVKAVTGTDDIVSNKNHFTRWEQWTDFYDWCTEAGIRLDESRGSSKVGDVGFTFGTAHPSFPVGDASKQNRPFSVLSLPLHTQDLGHAAHESCRDIILDGACAVHGIAHFLFHGPHLRNRAETAAAFERLMAAARDRGMPWWPAGRIDNWERRRRTVRLGIELSDGSATVTATSDVEVDGATILVSLPNIDADQVDSDEMNPVSVTRHGRKYIGICADLKPGSRQWQLRWS